MNVRLVHRTLVVAAAAILGGTTAAWSSAPCNVLILSGGPSAGDPIALDDDLTVYLNGTAIYVDDNDQADTLDPVAFAAERGDSLRITVEDAQPACRSVDPLYLHCASSGDYQVLDAVGQDDGCAQPGENRPAHYIFYDRTFTIAVRCDEDGSEALAGTPADGVASGVVHETVEPALGNQLGVLAHQVNCLVVVPVERLIDSGVRP